MTFKAWQHGPPRPPAIPFPFPHESLAVTLYPRDGLGRDKEIMRLFYAGLTREAIAAEIGVSLTTVGDRLRVMNLRRNP